MATCQGKTNAGEDCRAPASSGGLCYFHANPNQAKFLGQIGGRRNGKFRGVNLEVPEHMTATDLSQVITRAMRSLLSGELQAREAGALAQLCNLQHRLITTADLENHINRLEQQKTQQEQEKEALDAASTSSNINDMETAASVNLEQVAAADPMSG